MAEEPTTERGRRTRARIVEAAAALVAERGAEGTGVDQVIASAGVSKSQLYHYFADKDALVRAVVGRRYEELVEAQGTLLDELDTWAAIRRWLDLFVERSQSTGHHGCPMGTLADELADRDEAARIDLAGCFADWERHLVDGLTRMRERGELVATADPQDLATATFASLQGGLLLSKVHKDARPLRVALAAADAHLRSFRA